MRSKIIHETQITSHNGDYPYRYCKQKGFTLIEILITMAIMTVLFVATGTAFDAAFKNYDANNALNTVNVTHRNITHQLTSYIRSAYNDPVEGTIEVSSNGNTLSFTNTVPQDIIYQYNDDSKSISMQIDAGTPSTILENVVPIDETTDIFTLYYPPASDGFPDGTVAKVAINFTISYAGITKDISVAAVPRNVVFGK